MKALHIYKYGRFPQLVTKEIPIRKSNQVLIKMHFAPINPSDINFYQGHYGIRKLGFPIVGFQGSGVIIDADDPSIINHKVSIISNQNNGTHSTHIVSRLEDLVFWPNNTPLDQISMSIINPFSCIGLCDLIHAQRAQTVLLSAAGSSLNKMMIKFIKKYVPEVKKVIGMTRSRSTDQQLLKLGFDHIISTSNSIQQTDLIKSNGKTTFLDCIGGNFAGETFNLLPQNSIMINYGRLSRQNLGNINIGQLYYRNKQIRGFWLNTFIKQLGPEKYAPLKNCLIIDFKSMFTQKIRKIYPLSEFMQAYRQSIKDQSLGKILLDLSN